MQRIANRSIAICLVAMFVSAVREAQANRLSVPASACAPADITVAAKRLHIDEGGWVFRVDQMGSDITVVCPVSNWIFLQENLYSLTVWYRDTDGRGLNSKVMTQLEYRRSEGGNELREILDARFNSNNCARNPGCQIERNTGRVSFHPSQEAQGNRLFVVVVRLTKTDLNEEPVFLGFEIEEEEQ